MSTLLRHFLFALGGLAMLFAKPLFQLVQFALKSDTFSYIILIPFIVAYLLSLRWKAAAQHLRPSSWPPVLIPLGIGLLLLILNWSFAATPEVRLCLFILSFVFCVFAMALLVLGTAVFRQLAFPFALLFAMVPLPPLIMNGVEIFFQHASASAAAIMMKLSGLPTIRDGLIFQLPGLAIEVAQECSGVRSTMVLFITSLIAGYLLLRRPRDRAILALAIIPLAILRNGFRIFSLAWLSVEVNPDIIDSALHRRGGPIFFALSLIPLFLLLLLLRKMDRKQSYAS